MQRQASAPCVQQKVRRTISADQRIKLSAAQLAYVANDPRWIEHRRKLAAAQEARRMTLFPNEVTAILDMRKKGRTFSFISEEIGVCREVIARELAAAGIPTHRLKARRMTLLPNEVTAILDMRKKGRTFSFIAEEIGVCRTVIARELAAAGVPTERLKADRRACRAKGFWRSFD